MSGGWSCNKPIIIEIQTYCSQTMYYQQSNHTRLDYKTGITHSLQHLSYKEVPLKFLSSLSSGGLGHSLN